MIKAFKIFKKGVTNDWVTILIPYTDLTDELLTKKINFYASLGFEVELI